MLKRIPLYLIVLMTAASCSLFHRNGLVAEGDIWLVESMRDSGSDSMHNLSNVNLPSIEFMNNGYINGNSFCNGFSGEYRLFDKDNVEISIFNISRNRCETDSLEQELVTKLELTRRYAVVDSRLVLFDSRDSSQVTLIRASEFQKMR